MAQLMNNYLIFLDHKAALANWQRATDAERRQLILDGIKDIPVSNEPDAKNLGQLSEEEAMNLAIEISKHEVKDLDKRLRDVTGMRKAPGAAGPVPAPAPVKRKQIQPSFKVHKMIHVNFA